MAGRPPTVMGGVRPTRPSVFALISAELKSARSAASRSHCVGVKRPLDTAQLVRRRLRTRQKTIDPIKQSTW
jgi:hypothetical protein